MDRPESQNPRRRSEGVLTTRRQPVQWAGDLPFRILSLDGGGIKGIFPAAVLAGLEREHLEGRSVGDYFDLIAGTSTGGILALGLGAGMTADEILRMYLEEGRRVFPSKERGLAGRARKLFFAQYDRNALDELLKQRLGEKTLGESKYRLLIPSTEGRNGEVWVFKTPHHPDYRLDGDTPMSSVASATSAAPTYFTPFEQGGYTYLDGGVWANNPTMAALVEALSCFAIRREEVRILSIGCGENPFQITEGQARRSGMVHWRGIIAVAMHLQSVTAVNQAGLLIGRDRVIRLDRPDGRETIDLDDWVMAKDLLPGEAGEVVRSNASLLVDTFLTEPAAPFTPLA
ncbi:MAG: patatin-like phospholipase family protein [Chloroflexi bacterium]|nr:patatin-like phospholipase family protein [Chloroflexota bacterium]MYD49648.1 patatin-like phospholipase family protein [Chloroflexota bacterium]